ncbi:hypothetical protein BaRGS_00027692 [Batillaria attramentaria]|uniref:Uncharacterized protein n=1 Tax=Batillaria attramentaria TaxID=370345 RepID=A0ABD0K157_9CAEN
MSQGLPPQYGQAQNYPSGPVGAGDTYGYGKGPQGYGYDQPPPPNPYAASAGAAYPPPAASVPMSGTNYSTAYGNPSRFDDADPAHTDVAGNFSASFSDKAIRHAFIRKVYLILFSQLLVTFGFIAFFIFVKPVKEFVQTDGLWLYIVAYVTFLVTYIVLACCKNVRRKSPGNFICLAVFTLAFSYMAGTISSFHDTEIVLLAAGITAAVCLAISLFAIQTKIDFTMCSGLLFALVMVLFFFGWACLISYYAWGYNSILNTVYAGLGALVFALFLVYDTQMIIGGRKHELSAEEYIYGALQLYIDVVYIFLFLLSLMGKSN